MFSLVGAAYRLRIDKSDHSPVAPGGGYDVARRGWSPWCLARSEQDHEPCTTRGCPCACHGPGVIAPRRVVASPRPRPLLDLLVRFRSDPLAYLLRCAREDGPVTVFALGGPRLFVVSDPDLVHEVLVQRTKEFGKAHVPELDVLPWGRAILGRGLLVSEGEDWLRQRRLMQQAFHRHRMGAYEEIAASEIGRTLASWRDGEPRDVARDMSEFTLRLLARALFGADADAAFHEARRGLFEHRDPTKGLMYLIPEWVPTRANRETRRALRHLDATLLALIAARRAATETRDDLLGLLLAARDERGQGLDDRLVRDEIVSSTVAGQDTLAATLTWAIDTIAAEPAVVARLRAGDADHTERVVREVLRMFPPGKNIVRVATVDCEIAGLRVPRGASVILSQWVIHHDLRWYELPFRFDPDRWRPGVAEALPRHAYFPFGAGPRLCLGERLAELALRVVIPSVFAAFDLDGPPEGRRWDPARLRPIAGIRLLPRPALSASQA